MARLKNHTAPVVFTVMLIFYADFTYARDKGDLWLVLCELTEPKDRDIKTFQESTRCIFSFLLPYKSKTLSSV